MDSISDESRNAFLKEWNARRDYGESMAEGDIKAQAKQLSAELMQNAQKMWRKRGTENKKIQRKRKN